MKLTESCGFPAEATPARARTARANFMVDGRFWLVVEVWFCEVDTKLVDVFWKQ
jgi:hypothetical protein